MINWTQKDNVWTASLYGIPLKIEKDATAELYHWFTPWLVTCSDSLREAQNEVQRTVALGMLRVGSELLQYTNQPLTQDK
jgi:hypothetical protein